MKPDSRKTAAILCAAGGLVTAAILLQKSATGGTAARPEMPRHEATVPDARSPERTPTSCWPTEGTTHRATAPLGLGRVSGALSAAKLLRGAGGQVHASFELSADTVSIAGPRQPLNIALVIDRSGSMREEQKLVRAQEAANRLIDRLGPADRIALVQYDDTAQTLVSSTLADPESKGRLRAAVAALTPGGSTNLHGGLSLGRDEVQRSMAPGQVSRVILLSDGLANAGESSPTVIADTARSAADQGVRITAVGVGLEYNEDLMEAIAESGRGHYYYVRDAAALEPVLVGELDSAQATVAAQVELRLRFASVVAADPGPTWMAAGLAGASFGAAALFGSLARHVTVARRQAGEVDELLTRARAAVTASERAGDDPVVREAVRAEVARLVDVARRWQDLERRVATSPPADVLTARLNDLDRRILAATDPVARTQFEQAQAEVAHQLRDVEQIANARERVLARMHHTLASIERRRLGAAGAEVDCASHALIEAEEILHSVGNHGEERAIAG